MLRPRPTLPERVLVELDCPCVARPGAQRGLRPSSRTCEDLLRDDDALDKVDAAARTVWL
eukprot:8951164-Lingulodinium_polyedra.AAC.1